MTGTKQRKCICHHGDFMTINTPPLEDFGLILYSEFLISLEIGTETMFQTDLYQSLLSVYNVKQCGTVQGVVSNFTNKLFLINYWIPPNLDQ